MASGDCLHLAVAVWVGGEVVSPFLGSEQVPGVAGTFPIPCSHSALEGSKVHFAFFFSLVPSWFSDFNSCPGSLVAQLCTRTSI